MKVVQINAVYHHSSTGRTAEELHQYFISQGIESWVFYTGTPPTQRDSNVIHIGNFISNKIHAVFGRLTGLYGYASWLTTLRLLKRLDTIRPDAIILRNLHSNFINLPLLLKYLAHHDIHTLWVLHDCWAFTGGCVHYTFYHCDKWQTQCHHCQFRNDSWFRWNHSHKIHQDRKRLFSQIPHLHIVGVSHWVADEARKSFLADCSTIVHRYNWVNQQLFYPRSRHAVRQKYGFTDTDFIILSISQGWGALKGLNLFLQLAKHYKNARIVLVGKMHNACPQNVTNYPFTEDTDTLAEYYSMADVFVNLSQRETFSKVNIEAMACGTPVVCNGNTGMPETMGAPYPLTLPSTSPSYLKCEGGYVFKNNDLNSCYAAIDELKDRLANPEENTQIHDDCVAFINKHFSKDLLLADWKTLLSR